MISASKRTAGQPRGTRLRLKVVALLLSLVALWAFAAFVTLREGLNLLWVSTLDPGVGRPTESLVGALQAERRLSVVYRSSPTAREAQRQAMTDQRRVTDAAVTVWRDSMDGTGVSWAADNTLKARIRELAGLLDQLPAQRTAVDNGSGASVSGLAGEYTKIIDGAFRVYGSISALDDLDLAKQSRTLIALTRSRELLSQEDTLLAGVYAAGRFTGSDPLDLARLVSVQRYAYAEAAADLPGPERAEYDRLVGGDALTRLRAIEDQLIGSARSGAAPTIAATDWTTAIAAATEELRKFELASADKTVQRAQPAAIGVVVRLVLAGGLGLIAVIASIIISITTARTLLAQLVRLRDAADELATQRLPEVMEKLRRGERVDVDVEAPPLQFGTDEIGQVGHAFNAVQQSAVRAAVEQAELRRSVRDVFVSIARRSQGLIHRQLKTLDVMEREETDAANLAKLFDVDHLATRMRRNAENLIVLSGGTPGRAWRRPVPMIDVIRAATAEIEDYARVNVLPLSPASLVGRAVGDVIHLLAELVENAASFSPPHTKVLIGGETVSNGYVVEIEDRGLGMGEAALAAANDQVRNPPEIQLSGNVRLGLYVVGKLAERHGILVHLRRSPYGGTTAVVLIPSALIVAHSEDEPGPAQPAPINGTATAAQPMAAATAQQSMAARSNPASEGRHAAVAVMPRPAEAAHPDIEALADEPAPAIPASAPAATTAPEPATVFGLPRRSRKQPEPKAPEQRTPPAAALPPRSPEVVSTRMAAFQRGSQQARREAAGADNLAGVDDPDHQSEPATEDPVTHPHPPAEQS